MLKLGNHPEICLLLVVVVVVVGKMECLCVQQHISGLSPSLFVVLFCNGCMFQYDGPNQ